MDWKHWLIVILIAFTAGWMVFDGSRALLAGDYVTPTSGEYAGQLGPWSNLVKAIGIEPRSTLMKSIFVAYGLITLSIVVCFVRGLAWARTVLIIMCILDLWYLPVGTMTNLIALVLLFLGKR
jgi:hypothetical protein